jgi:two-component system, response regulator PdtaR
MMMPASPIWMQSAAARMAGTGASAGEKGSRPDRENAKRIAIVEDELMVAWSLESMAQDLGHEVIGIYPSGEAALAGLADEEANLVFMDINLGSGMDGIETARRLRNGSRVPILFISAYADPATRTRVQEAVPDAMLLGKPVSGSALARAIEAMGCGLN